MGEELGYLYFLLVLILMSCDKLGHSFNEANSFSLMTSMDALVLKEAEKHGMCVEEVNGTRTTISNLEGVIFEITLK